MSTTIPAGTVHAKVPADLKKLLLATPNVLEAWADITPLARNEWICFIEEAKKEETRERRLKRMFSQMKEGQRRPCCWTGCPHR